MLLQFIQSILFNSNDRRVLLLLHLSVTLSVTHHGHSPEADHVTAALTNMPSANTGPSRRHATVHMLPNGPHIAASLIKG